MNRSQRPSQSFGSVCYEVWVSKVDVNYFLSLCPLRRSISTIDRFFLVWVHIDGQYRPIFFGMNPYWQSISTDCFLKSTDDAISTVFSSRWISIDRPYPPYSQEGDSALTVDIDLDKSTGRSKNNRPIDALQDIMSMYFFLSFFLGFRRPNLITGLSGWQTPD